MSDTIAAQMLSTARAVFGGEPNERARAQIEQLARHVRQRECTCG